MEDKVFEIGRLRHSVAGRLVMEDGTKHDVLRINGRQKQALNTAKASQAMDRLYEIAGQLVPTLPTADVLEFNIDQVNAIIGISGVGVAAIEALYPNVESPAAPTSPG